MATDAEVTAAGYTLPEGTDLISHGDDAIRANARAAYGDVRAHVHAQVTGTALASGTDANTQTGIRTIPNRAIALGIANLPVAWPGILRTYGAGETRFQTYAPTHVGLTGTNGADLAPLYVRRADQTPTGWTPWVALTAGTQHGTREGDLRLADLRRRIGPVTVHTPAAVTIVMDHGLTNVKNKVLPLLRARGLRATLSINAGRWGDPDNAGTTQADVKTWADVFELANHGQNHTLTDSPVQARAEVEDGRANLETQLGVPIDTYVQTGNGAAGSYTFDDGRDPASYWTTETGRIIARSHALWTGLVPPPATGWPLDGHPKPGASGTWIDTAAGRTSAQTLITSAINAGGRGIIVRLHPQYLDTAGYLTTAQLTTFLDWLVARRDAGEVTVLPYREWSLARSSEATRDTGWRNVSSLLNGVNASSELLLCRIGNIVFLDFRSIVPTTLSSGGTIYQLPVGFRPSSDVNWSQNTSLAASSVRSAFVTAGGPFGVWAPNTADTYSNVISYPCRQPWPTTLPGTPA